MKLLHYLASDAAVILTICAIAAIVLIYKICISGRKLVLSDILYTGHVFVLTALFFIIYCFIYFNIVFHQKRRAFDEMAWKVNQAVRVEMIDDLLKQKFLQRKSIGEITNRLGRPMFGYKDKLDIITVYYYYLGIPAKVFVLDPEFLVIEFKNNVTEKYYLSPKGPFGKK